MKPTRLALAVCLLPLGSVAMAVAAGQEPLKLSDSVITANRGVQDRADSTAAVTVFTRDDIDRLQAFDVPDLLSRVPGVQITQNGGRGSTAGVLIRGTSTAQTLVLVDGMRIGSVTAGGANGALDHLNIEQIERIEVLRGPRAAIYGADAIGGVIQVFTRRAEGEGLHGRVRVAVGNHGVRENSAGISGGNQQTRFNLSASLDEMTGFDRTRRSDAYSADDDSYRNKAVSFSLSHAFSDELRLGLNILDQQGKNEFDTLKYHDSWSNQDFFYQPYSDFESSSVAGFAELQVTGYWLSRLELGYSEDKLSGRDKLPANKMSDYDINSYRESANWLNTFQLNQQHTLRTGLDFLKDKVRTDDENSSFDKEDRRNSAGFIQHSYQGDYFATELGVRHDNNQHYGSENTWNAALSLPVAQRHELIFSYAEGFRAPTFNDLFHPQGSNPNLDAEESKTYELQWRAQLSDRVAIETSLYRTKLRNAITLDELWIPQNTQTVRVNGLESSLQHQLFGAYGSLNVAIIDSRNRKTDKRMPRIAKRTLSYDLDKQMGDFSVGATWQLASDSYDDAANERQTGGYGTLDLRGSWQATRDFGLSLRLANIFDKQYSRALYQYDGDYYGYRENRFTVLLAATWTPRFF